jgi:hypothetical protein
VIYHVGTIGCVGDPVSMTSHLLNMLRRGGRLLFNAPNRDACALPGQLWFDSAPPPDVVTMYPPGFWRSHFGRRSKVEETIEYEPPIRNALIGLRILTRRRWRKPVPIALEYSNRSSAPVPLPGDEMWNNFERVVRRVGPWTGLLALVPPRPSEYGLFVEMKKK